MHIPLLLLIVSVVGILAAVVLPDATDLLLLAAPCALASLLLLLRAFVRRGGQAPQEWVVIDGSNVMHWRDNTPDIATLREVIGQLTARGLTAGVVFDANAGYLTAGRYQDDRAIGRQLGLLEDRVLVVAKGTPADPVLLAAARDLNARIVSNDRYRDWTDTHPEVREPGRLIRGGYRNGTLWMDLDQRPSLRTRAIYEKGRQVPPAAPSVIPSNPHSACIASTEIITVTSSDTKGANRPRP